MPQTTKPGCAETRTCVGVWKVQKAFHPGLTALWATAKSPVLDMDGVRDALEKQLCDIPNTCQEPDAWKETQLRKEPYLTEAEMRALIGRHKKPDKMNTYLHSSINSPITYQPTFVLPQTPLLAITHKSALKALSPVPEPKPAGALMWRTFWSVHIQIWDWSFAKTLLSVFSLLRGTKIYLRSTKDKCL